MISKLSGSCLNDRDSAAVFDGLVVERSINHKIEKPIQGARVRTKNKGIVVVAIAALMQMAACGGGGGSVANSQSVAGPGATTDSGTTYVSVCTSGSVVTSNTSQADADSKCPVAVSLAGTGIADVKGSVCAWYDGQSWGRTPRVMDLDNRGYVFWTSGRVRCAKPDGTTEDIGGLKSSAFSFTGNGVTNGAPEDLVAGQAASDSNPTYTIQLYRAFTSTASVTAETEKVEVTGQDALGRTITARGVVYVGSAWSVDELGSGGTAAAARTFRPDNQGYTATTWQVALYTRPSLPACPTGGGVKDQERASTSVDGTPVVRRFCLYTDLTEFRYKGDGILDMTSTWRWTSGPEANIQPISMVVTRSALVTATANGSRIPIYKIESDIRYPKAPNGGWQDTEGAIGWMLTDIPALGAIDQPLTYLIPIAWPD